MKKSPHLPDLSNSYFIIFAATMADATGLRLSDADYRDWSILCRVNAQKCDYGRLGIFELWSYFLQSRNMDIDIHVWSGSCNEN